MALFSGVSNGLLLAIASVPVTYFLAVALGRWLKRDQGVRLGLVYKLFSILLAISVALALQSRLDPAHPIRIAFAEWDRHLIALTALLGTLCALSVLRRYFWELWFERRNRQRAPKFVADLVGLLIFVTVVLVIISVNYGISIPGLVAGSTVVAAILGFALQDLLGNIIAGIALEIGKPFRTGDWLVLEGKHLEVIEVNWRSTRLRSNDDVYSDVPNKNIVGSTIQNLTYPTRQHAMRLTVRFEYTASPNQVKDCLRRAAANAHGVLHTPPPNVFLKDFAENGIVYEIKFWMEDQSRCNDIMDAIRTNVWYEAQRNHLRIPAPVRTVQIDRPQKRQQDKLEQARTAARRHPFLQLLDEPQVERLLRTPRLLHFGRGERVIEQGAAGESMFILLSGEAEVRVRANGSDTRVATLRADDYCGEMSLLTGEPRSATVVAREDCEVWEIGKEVLGDILQENQALVERLSDLLARHRLENEGLLASREGSGQFSAKRQEYSASFLRKIFSYFEL